MNAPAFRYPSGTEVGDLVQTLAGRPFRSIWIGPLLLHHIDAPIRIRRELPLPPFARGVLLAMPADEPIHLPEFAVRLGVAPALLCRAIHDLHHSHGLVHRHGDEQWRRGSAAEEAIKDRKTSRDSLERRAFHFLERRNGSPPHFVRLRHAACLPHQPGDSWSFHPETLHGCFAQPDDWKQRHRFPLEFQPPDALEGEQRLILDQAEWLPALLIESDEWQLFGMKATEPKLAHAEPVARWSPTAAREALNGLASEPTTDEWHAAWQAFCAAEGISIEEAKSSELEFADQRLRVTAPPPLAERVKALRGQWLLAGSGPLRRAARIE